MNFKIIFASLIMSVAAFSSIEASADMEKRIEKHKNSQSSPEKLNFTIELLKKCALNQKADDSGSAQKILAEFLEQHPNAALTPALTAIKESLNQKNKEDPQ